LVCQYAVQENVNELIDVISLRPGSVVVSESHREL